MDTPTPSPTPTPTPTPTATPRPRPLPSPPAPVPPPSRSGLSERAMRHPTVPCDEYMHNTRRLPVHIAIQEARLYIRMSIDRPMTQEDRIIIPACLNQPIDDRDLDIIHNTVDRCVLDAGIIATGSIPGVTLLKAFAIMGRGGRTILVAYYDRRGARDEWKLMCFADAVERLHLRKIGRVHVEFEQAAYDPATGLVRFPIDATAWESAAADEDHLISHPDLQSRFTGESDGNEIS